MRGAVSYNPPANLRQTESRQSGTYKSRGNAYRTGIYGKGVLHMKSNLQKEKIMLEINQKTDIIVPFENIGDEHWKANTQKILEALADNWGNEFIPNPICNDEIKALENRLNCTLPESLKRFYRTFGIVDIGEELIAIDNIDYAQKFWQHEYAPNFSDAEWQIIPNLVWFGDYLGNGNLFCFHKESKEIYYFDHDNPPYISKLFDDFGDYLKGCLILAQADLWGEVGQEEVENWTEEIVIEQFGKEVIKKWRY